MENNSIIKGTLNLDDLPFLISKKWCSGTGQKRSPHLRACPNSISFEPSRRPSVANAFLYRESFWRAILTNQSFGVFIL